MSLQFEAKPIFAAHQTFHPRFGWLKKAYDAATSDSNIFNREDATVQLGVGKNMVEAIRFWGQSLRIITTSSAGKKKGSVAIPTNIGRVLFDSENGLDPFVENPSTLWLLHWLGNSRDSMLPIWRIFFNEYSAVEFATDEFTIFAEEQLSGTPWRLPAKASIEKDVDCIIRMYCTRAARGRQTIDDLMDSPFRQLGLVTSSPAGPDSYRFVMGDKPFLTDLLIAYAALDFIAINDPTSKTVTTTRLSSDSGSPGRILKISEMRLLQALENTSELVEGLKVASPAGASQLVVDSPVQELASKILLKIYKGTTGSLKKISIPIVGHAARNANLIHETKTVNTRAS